MNAPCRNCENKGCGSYHDHCPAFKKFREERNCVNERREQKKRDCGCHIKQHWPYEENKE